MSLSDKPFYFITDRATLFHYFVDNSINQRQKHIFYPRKYETMTAKQIVKYEQKLVYRLLWWSLSNKDKMAANDWQACKSKVIDMGMILLVTLFIARLSRTFLFRHQFVSTEAFLDGHGFDIKFWKTICAYSASYWFGYRLIKSKVKDTFLVDLALEYSPNYNQELSMPELDEVLNKLYVARFPWLQKKQN